MKQKKKVRKFKFLKFLLFLLMMYLVYLFIVFFFKIKIKNIYIYNNTYLTDQEIIDLANLNNYPSFIKTTSHSINKKLKQSPFILKAVINKRWGFRLDITIDENKVLYRDINQRIFFADQTNLIIDQKILGVPLLINYVPDTIVEDFIKRLTTVEKSILTHISEIKYDPNDFDEERFLLSMNDGNYVYITLSKIENINYYLDVLGQLEGKKGILYLDSGNHFKIME
ncbi:MAG: FtsQ-type POTRA domain-containing protein [Tenericutes bacterium]|nr:FtsQ-type POTRA domain-containing protein [Mycoplasmatota bacterium]